MDRPLVSIQRHAGQVRVVATSRAMDGAGIVRVASSWREDLRVAVADFQFTVDRALAQPLRGMMLRRLSEELAKKP